MPTVWLVSSIIYNLSTQRKFSLVGLTLVRLDPLLDINGFFSIGQLAEVFKSLPIAERSAKGREIMEKYFNPVAPTAISLEHLNYPVCLT